MAVLRDRHVVLDADADPLPALLDRRLPLGHRQPVADIQARLHRQHHARLQHHGVLAEAVGAHVVDIEAQPVAGAVHVQVPVGALLDDAVRLAAQQAQLQQTLHQHAHSGFMHALGGLPRRHHRHRCLLGRQHQLVQGPLLAREAAVDRESAGDVAVVVIAQRAAGVDQQQVAVAQHVVVGGVVQHAGVVAAGDDRTVGGAAGSLLEEVLLDHRLHLPLAQPRPRHPAGQLMGFGGDAGGLAQALQLLGALAQSHLMQDRAGRHQAEGGMAAARGAVQLAAPGLQHQRFHLRVAADAEGNPLRPVEIAGEALRQFAARMGQIGAEAFHRSLAAPTEAVPHLRAGIARLDEQHERVVGLMGQEQGHRPGLVEAGEIPEIAVLAEGVLDIGVVGHQRRRRDHRGRTSESPQELGPPLRQELRIDQGLGHGGRPRTRTEIGYSEKMTQPLEWR